MEQAVVAPARASWIPWALLVVGVLGASISAILIVYARDAQPMAISFWRCAGGAAALAPFAARGLRAMTKRQLGLPAVAGLFLAAHFATWITSLELTTVAASVLLVTSSPAFVALLAWWLLGERLRSVAWVGIVLTVIGAGLVAGGDLSGAQFEGNMLALAGALTVGVYMLVGQVSRRELGILEYSVVTYSVAGLVLLPISLVMGADLWGYDAQTSWALVGLLIGPQLLGHTVLNYVLKDLGATIVAVAVMAEPLIAAILAYILFGQVPPLLIYPGGAAILVGIYIVSTRGKSPQVVIE
ncbi:MAG: DMT family transporter [Actinobacteria bacterium]|nr:DMT family transporter [Actinomycetota bacterium]